MGWEKKTQPNNIKTHLSSSADMSIFFSQHVCLSEMKVGGWGKYFFTSQAKAVAGPALKWLGLFPDPDPFLTTPT